MVMVSRVRVDAAIVLVSLFYTLLGVLDRDTATEITLPFLTCIVAAFIVNRARGRGISPND